MHLSPQFDAGLLRADPLRGGRRQYGCLGAGIEEKKDRCAIGENLDDRLVIKHRNRGLGQAKWCHFENYVAKPFENLAYAGSNP
jgi:hypothetical protein